MYNQSISSALDYLAIELAELHLKRDKNASLCKTCNTKVDKLSKEQVETLLDMVLEENEMFDAVMESVNTGLLICDKSGNCF